ncbi:MAG: hypothetical protein GY861_13440 [bacterium]|nr:hypothetical protein [bacterium]
MKSVDVVISINSKPIVSGAEFFSGRACSRSECRQVKAKAQDNRKCGWDNNSHVPKL